MGLTKVVPCLPLVNGCNAKVENVGSQNDVHHCGKKPGHRNAHTCICYWAWS